MDTKLKKYSRSMGIKSLAFVLCVLFFVSSILSLFLMVEYTNGSDPFDRVSSKGYEDSSAFESDLTTAMDAASTIYHYENEESIKSGKFVSPYIEKYKASNYYYEYIQPALEANWPSDGKEMKNSKYEPFFTKSKDVDMGEEFYYYEEKSYDSSTRKYILEEFGAEVAEHVKDKKNEEIKSQLSEFARAKSTLHEFSYFISDGTKMVTNMSGDLNAATDVEALAKGINTGHIVNKGYESYYGVQGNYKDTNQLSGGITNVPELFSSYSEDEFAPGSLSVYVGYNEDLWKSKSTNYDETRTIVVATLAITVSTCILALALLIFLIVVTGHKDEDDKIKLYYADKLFTEFQLGIIIGLPVIAAILGRGFIFTDYGYREVVNSLPDIEIGAYVLTGFSWLIIASIGLWWILSIVRLLKAHEFLSRSLIFICVKALYKWIKAAFNKANPMGKFVIIIVAACLVSMTVVLAPIVIVLLLGFGYRWIRKYTELKKGVEEVNSGNLEYKIPVDDKANTEFDQLARQINSISMASNVAIQNELKNQRLKTDLISNVSHDLKTPLTSIITYTDLLKKEGLGSPNAESYLSVIDDKGQRLKALTEDLFEAAKASSGSIPVRLEKVDILSLINQGLVELDEGLKEKGLDIIINAPSEKYYVNADSQLLWRVVENLLNNLEKYALENSRVYIDLSEKLRENGKPDTIMFEMKNMSKAPLNIAEEELMERFKRGDESRTTEGSGLGLAIAKDLVKLQNGIFELKIDGDLFKSIVVLESYNEDTIKAAQRYADEKEAIEEKIQSINKDDGRPRIRN